MQYMILIYEPAGCYDGEAGQAALQDIVAKHMALAGELRAKGVQKEGSGLQGVETATTIVTGPGGSQTVHDGPFAETREQLGGFYLVEAKDLDEAIDLAARIPSSRVGTIEVRPIMPTPPPE